MSVRKPVDYSAMFGALDTLIAADLLQTKLYCEIGKLRPLSLARCYGKDNRKCSSVVKSRIWDSYEPQMHKMKHTVLGKERTHEH